MPRIILAKTAGSTIVELSVVIAIIASLAAMAVPTFVAYRDKARITQVVGSSEAIRAALASYAASNAQNVYPLTGAITDFNSLRLVVNAHGGMLPRWVGAASRGGAAERARRGQRAAARRGVRRREAL